MGLAVQYTSRLVGSEANFGVWAVRNGLGLLWPPPKQLHVRARCHGIRLENPMALEMHQWGHGGVSDPQLTNLWDDGGLFLKPHAIARPSFASLADGAAGALHPRL